MFRALKNLFCVCILWQRGLTCVRIGEVSHARGVTGAANAAIERSVWEMQSTRRATVAHAEWVHDTVCEPGSAILAWAVEFSDRWSAGSKEAFRIGRQRMNAGCRKASAQRLFHSLKW